MLEKFEKFNEKAAISGVIISIGTIIAVALTLNVFWPWFVPIGFVVSFGSSYIINKIITVST